MVSNPSEKYESNWIISPSKGENKTILKPPPTSSYKPYINWINPNNTRVFHSKEGCCWLAACAYTYRELWRGALIIGQNSTQKKYPEAIQVGPLLVCHKRSDVGRPYKWPNINRFHWSYLPPISKSLPTFEIALWTWREWSSFQECRCQI